MARDVRIKRIYDPAESGDGYRVMVDHVWLRSVSRERAQLDQWARELAPATSCASGSRTCPSGSRSFGPATAASSPLTPSWSTSSATTRRMGA